MHNADADDFEYECPRCPGNKRIIENHKTGDVVCLNCGLVLAERIVDRHSEWRTFSNDDGNRDEMNRVGAAYDPRFTNVVSTRISSTDAQGRKVRGGLDSTSLRIQTGNSMSRTERTMLQAAGAVTEMCDKLGLSKNVVDLACSIYNEIITGQVLRGKNVKTIYATCIYAACKQLDVPKSIKEICDANDLKRSGISKAYKFVKERVPEKLTKAATDVYIRQYCHKLALKGPIVDAMSTASENILARGHLGGRNPKTICAVSIYLISQLSSTPKSFKEIATVIDIGEQTVRHAYKDIYPNWGEVIPTNFAPVSASPPPP
ncbi:putative Transcription initiation factor IIB [Blattamonas nauphoetae]|uniref:Transcription initiation factor IIB n=1 Tax=Blattamonas nauphoetae TaxID=2049346 RepID=A0ABQ9YCR5_9EUKA|nr:putative Transcription initiation factor IIB [Blattamonas nauphoetae]